MCSFLSGQICAWALWGPSSLVGFVHKSPWPLDGCRQGGSPRQVPQGRDRIPQPLPGPKALLSPPQVQPHQSHPTQSPTISTHALARLQGHQHRACGAASLWPLPPISKASSSMTFSLPPQRSQSTEVTVHGGHSPETTVTEARSTDHRGHCPQTTEPQSTEWTLTQGVVHRRHGPQTTEATAHGGDSPLRTWSTEAMAHGGCGPQRPRSTEALGQTYVDKLGAPIPSENRDPRGAATLRTRPRCPLTPDPVGCSLGHWDPPGCCPTNSFRETASPPPRDGCRGPGSRWTEGRAEREDPRSSGAQ